MGLDRRGCVVQPRPRVNRQREELVDKAKPFDIPKREVWEAFKSVKANQGAAEPDIFGAIWLETGEIVIDESLDPEERPAMEGRYHFTLGHEGAGNWRLHRPLVQANG